MKFEKNPTTIEEQIELLSDRGMDITCPALVERWLKTVGYYRLSAYWLPFEEKPADGQTRSKKFIEKTRFEDVIDIYTFDRKLRLLVTEAIERIEINVRSRWSNHFSLEYGAHGHLTPELFISGEYYEKLYEKMSVQVNISKEVFIQHYKEKYTKPSLPPLWAATELMTFGELSKWVKVTKDSKLKKAVARDIGLPTKETLDSTLHVLCYVRNICAHHGRLWNRKTVFRIQKIKLFRDSLEPDHVANAKGQLQQSNYIYNVLSVLVLLMRHQASDTTFPKRLRKLIETRTDTQRYLMGFPENWTERPAWYDQGSNL